jgi:4-amino-4-deoxy-L-arabinose transferase-like glycosyltransferase
VTTLARALVPSRLGRGELLGLGLLLLAGAAVLGRKLTGPSAEFDEAVYLASARALTQGAELGGDVFSSQPPLFFSLLEGAYALADGNAVGLRALMLVLTLGGGVAAWALVRPLGGPIGGLAAAALFIAAPAVAERAAVVSADVPSIALGIGALAAAAAVGRRAVWGLAAGALLVAALMVKLLAAPFVPAVLVGLWAARAGRAAYLWAVAGAAAVAVAVLAPHAGAIAEIWTGAIGAREAARGVVASGPGGTDWLQVLGFVGLGGAALVALASSIGAPREWWRERASILALLAGGILFCLVHRPLFSHHYVAISAPLALWVASAWPRLKAAPVVVGAVLLMLAPLAIRARETPPRDYSEQRVAAVLLEEETSPRQPVVSDLPLVPILADRDTPPGTIDASYVRMGSDPEAPELVLEATDGAGAVVAGRAFLADPALLAAIRERFPRVRSAGDIRIYLPARPSGRPSAPIS